ncbi:MAG: HAD-IA family hydrolase [Treponema sp.]|nr:HAD-IA family hydrolase [Treponema sp.]
MIRHILFDLDCTLYSVNYGLEEKVAFRLWQYVAHYLGISIEEAAAARNKAIGQFGTTLEWLMVEKGFTDIDDYMAKIHPEDEADSLPGDPKLRRFLESLPCPSSILTNSPGFHAERIISKLGLEGVFCRVFDIEGSGYRGKPHASAYRRALDTLGHKPEEVLFVDDVIRYVDGYISLGGKGILLDENDAHKDYPRDRIKNLRELVRYL